MAGFDFDFSFADSQAPFLEPCLAASMSRARKLGLSWTNQRLGSHLHRCIVDGNGRRMDLLAHALERDIPLVAEGVQGTGLTPVRRRRLGLGFADLYIRGLDWRTDATIVWRGVSRTRYYFTPYELAPENFAEGDVAADLAIRLRITESIIIDWFFERTPGAVLLEELHTASELVLEYLVNQRSKRLSFAELVDRARAQGLLDWPLPEVAEMMGAPKDAVSLLLELKDFRKEARHRASRAFEPWLKENWEAVAIVLERLARLAVQGPTRQEG